MGITGLLPILKPTLIKKHIQAFSNKRVGIDGFAWLYPILNFIPEELYYNIPTTKHIHIFESKIKNLIAYNIIPVVIFDGDSLDAKSKTNLERKEKKEKSREEVEYFLKRNNSLKAREIMKRCISVNKEIVYDITRLLKRLNIEYIIAPYEADAQLCYLENIGYIDCILTEDSDLIAFGCRNILFKFDNSHVDHYTEDCLQKAKDKVFKERIQDICILSGCDYADSIPGIGILTAYKYIKKVNSIENAVKLIGMKKEIPEDYMKSFEMAKLTFNHQVVYDPIEGKRRHLKPIEISYEFLGNLEEQEYFIEREVSKENCSLDGILRSKEIEEDSVYKIYVERHYKPNVIDQIIFEEIDINPNTKQISAKGKTKKIDEHKVSPFID